MKKSRRTLMITFMVIMLSIWGFIIVQKGTNLFKGIDVFIFAIIIILGVVALINAYKKDKEEREGYPAEDELSTIMKYKAGYYAYLSSMYMWLFIFLLRDKFPDVETMVGGGILLSALIAFISKIKVKNSLNGK
jgi:hypothetical protein